MKFGEISKQKFNARLELAKVIEAPDHFSEIKAGECSREAKDLVAGMWMEAFNRHIKQPLEDDVKKQVLK